MVSFLIAACQFETLDAVNLVESIEKFANPVYSITSAILLRLKELSKLGRPNPFFGTRSIRRQFPRFATFLGLQPRERTANFNLVFGLKDFRSSGPRRNYSAQSRIG